MRFFMSSQKFEAPEVRYPLVVLKTKHLKNTGLFCSQFTHLVHARLTLVDLDKNLKLYTFRGNMFTLPSLRELVY